MNTDALRRLLRPRGIVGWVALSWAAISIWSNADFLANRDWNNIIEAALSVILARWFGLILLVAGLAWLGVVATRTEPVRQVSRDIVLVAPLPGSKVDRTFTVEGLAGTFEHNVIVERRDEKGQWQLVGGPEISGSDDDGYSLGPRFTIGVTLPPGRHRLRVGDHDAEYGKWDGVEFEVRVVGRQVW